LYRLPVHGHPVVLRVNLRAELQHGLAVYRDATFQYDAFARAARSHAGF
jgi:hypothetical protein